MRSSSKQPPGRVRDAIIKVFEESNAPLSIPDIETGVRNQIGETPTSSIRSYLRLNTPQLFVRERRGVYRARTPHASSRQRFFTPVENSEKPFSFRDSTLYHEDCFSWLDRASPRSVHAIVTDPPYGLHEYTDEQQRKLRAGKGGVWRIPPSFDGHRRSPLPRFTTLDEAQLGEIREFFVAWGRSLTACWSPEPTW